MKKYKILNIAKDTIKPTVIVCSETWSTVNKYLYEILEYKIYNNNSMLIKADVVVVYVHKNVKHKINYVKVASTKLLNVELNLNNGKKLLISALYKSHLIDKTFLIDNLYLYTSKLHNLDNHIVIGDCNIYLFTNEVE